jgi:hypothetical protein
MVEFTLRSDAFALMIGNGVSSVLLNEKEIRDAVLSERRDVFSRHLADERRVAVSNDAALSDMLDAHLNEGNEVRVTEQVERREIIAPPPK